MYKNIFEKIETLKAKVCVIGAGYVGLPLIQVLLESGFQVSAIEQNPQRLQKLLEGDNYIEKKKNLLKFVKSGDFSASDDYFPISISDVIIVCVPTPIKSDKTPNMQYIEKAVMGISGHLKKGHLIIIESSIYPGATEEFVLPLLQESGLKVGEDFFLCYSPERIDPGNKEYNLKNTPKIIAGITGKCEDLGNSFYVTFIESVWVATDCKTVEIMKMFENTFRCVNIALINEFSVLCEKMGIDTKEVIDLCATKPYGFMPFYPGPGIGGHCIPVDPFYLHWKARELGIDLEFIELAGKVNERRIQYISNNIIKKVASTNRDSNRHYKILFLGVAYKKDIDDIRESPSIKIIEEVSGALMQDIDYNDNYVPSFTYHPHKESTITAYSELRCFSKKALRNYDCIVLLTDHSYYPYQKIYDNAKLIIDTRNVFPRYNNKVVHI